MLPEETPAPPPSSQSRLPKGKFALLFLALSLLGSLHLLAERGGGGGGGVATLGAEIGQETVPIPSLPIAGGDTPGGPRDEEGDGSGAKDDGDGEEGAAPASSSSQPLLLLPSLTISSRFTKFKNGLSSLGPSSSLPPRRAALLSGTVQEVCEAVETKFWTRVEANCKGRAPYEATSLEHSEVGPLRVLGYVQSPATSQTGSPPQPHSSSSSSSPGISAPLSLSFSLVTSTASGQLRSTGGDWFTALLYSSPPPSTSPSLPPVSPQPVQSPVRLVDHWDGTYDLFFTLPRAGDYTLVLSHDYTACAGYQLDAGSKSRAKRSLDYLGVRALELTLNLSYSSPSDPPSPSDPQPPSPASAASLLLSDLGHFQGTTWFPPVSTPLGVRCSSPPPSPPPPIPSSVAFAGDSTQSQLVGCFFGHPESVPFGAGRPDDKAPDDLCSVALEATFAGPWARGRPAESVGEGGRASAKFENTDQREAELLATWHALRSNTVGDCRIGENDKYVKPNDYCLMSIMSKDTGWAMKSEAAVQAFMDLPPSNRVTVLSISESAHLMSSYDWAEIKGKADAIARIVNGNSRGDLQILWRENWAMQEYAIWPTDYLPPAPNDERTKAFAGGTGPTLSAPQAALHRSLFLDKINHGTGGRVQITPAYWQSQAWIKRLKGLTGRYGSRGWASVFGYKTEWNVDDDSFFFSDMRHMQSPVYLASLIGIIDMLRQVADESI